MSHAPLSNSSVPVGDKTYDLAFLFCVTTPKLADWRIMKNSLCTFTNFQNLQMRALQLVDQGKSIPVPAT